MHEISNNVVCAISKASDQPVHRRSLIRAFASPLIILWLLGLSQHWTPFGVSKLNKRRLQRLARVYTCQNVKLPRLIFVFQHANEDVEKMILGNKCDMEDKRQVSKDRGEAVSPPHWPGPEVIKLFSCSTQQSSKFQLLIKTKKPTNKEVSCFKSLRCCIYHADKC